MTTWICTNSDNCDHEMCVHQGSSLPDSVGCGEGTWRIVGPQAARDILADQKSCVDEDKMDAKRQGER